MTLQGSVYEWRFSVVPSPKEEFAWFELLLGRQLGEAGRAMAVAQFSEAAVVDATLRLYRDILGPRWPVTTAAHEAGAGAGTPA